MIINRVWCMPNKNTFNIKPIKELILNYKKITPEKEIWIDPFANINKFADITNDINNNYNTDYHLDALDFLKKFENNSIYGILFDPPFSPRQLSECYHNLGIAVTMETTQATFWSNLKKEIARIIKPNGICISFGWNSGGIGKSLGFGIEEILLVAHGGNHNDTICTVNKKYGSKGKN